MQGENNQNKSNSQDKSKKGGFNLILMGIIAIVIAMATTGVSMAIYHNSGDIYLDRSRPGFLPDEEEIEDDDKKNEVDFDFSKVDKLNAETIKEYLENINKEIEEIDAYKNPFSAEVLSDENLGIPIETANE